MYIYIYAFVGYARRIDEDATKRPGTTQRLRGMQPAKAERKVKTLVMNYVTHVCMWKSLFGTKYTNMH